MARALIRRGRPSLLWLAVGSVACLADPPPLPALETGQSSGDGATGGGITGGVSSTPPTTGVDGESSGDASPPTTDGTVSATGEPTIDMGSTCAGPIDQGGECSDDCECSTGQCYVTGPLGGVCSECNEDDDCIGVTGHGCNPGNPIVGTAAVCSQTGGLGEGCESDAVCQSGLGCSVVVDIPGILTNLACGECIEDFDCEDVLLCGVVYDVENIRGFRQCVEPASVPNDEGCVSNSQCQSGVCAPTSIMGIPLLSVCSPCSNDVDCPGMKGCLLPEVTIGPEILARTRPDVRDFVVALAPGTAGA